VHLEDVVPGERGSVQISVLLVKFDRVTVIGYIRYVLKIEDSAVSVTITGELLEGTSFGGSDTIRVISKATRI